MIHTVITSFATVDAGRQPLASIQNVLQPAPPALVSDKDTVKNIFVDTQELSFHSSTVPSTLRRVLTINRMDGFATVVRRATRTVSLSRVRTINRKAGAEILERRKASLTPNSSSNASDLKRARTITKNAGRELLERRKAPLTPISSSNASNLMRVRTINKKAGHKILERRKASLTPDSSNASSLKRVRTIVKKAGCKILERRKASFTPDSSTISSDESDTSTLVDHTVSLKRVRTINGNAGRELLQRRKAAQSVDSPITLPDNSYISCDNSSYFDIKRGTLGLEVAAPVRRTVLEYPIIYFSKGTRIFTEKVSVRNIPVTLPTPEYEIRKRTRSIKFADEISEELSIGDRWKQVAGASSL